MHADYGMTRPLMPTTTVIIAAMGTLAVSFAINAAAILLLAVPFDWFWNASLPAIFSLPRIDYPKSVALLGLLAIAHGATRGIRIAAKLRW